MQDSTSPAPAPSKPPSESPESLAAFTASPASLALLASRGKWKLYRHLETVNRALLRVAAGEIRRLMILTPPQVGKSTVTSCYLPAWWIATYRRPVILASYEHSFAAAWGRRARNVLEEYGGLLWGIRVNPEARAADWWELEGEPEAAMFCAGAGGPLTGKPASLAIIDDPHKNAEEAASATIREKIAEWYFQVLRSRVHEGGAIVLCCTRWHDDDLAGRLMRAEKEGGDRWEVLRLPALAEEADPLGRAPGEPLCPEMFSLANLEETRRAVGPWIWATTYQAAPYVREGGFFPVDKIGVVTTVPENLIRVRGWDEASSTTGDWTVGTLLGKAADDSIYVLDVMRLRAAPGERDAAIVRTVTRDGPRVRQCFQQEPGSAGVSRVEELKRLLRGFWLGFDRPSGDKTVRAGSAASAVDAGRVKAIDAPWLRDFLEELRAFPNGRFDDQPDAFAWAFEALRGAGWSVLRRPEQKPELTPEQKIALGINPGTWPEDRALRPSAGFARGSAFDGLRVRSPFPRRRPR